jgi:hypothetical protein
MQLIMISKLRALLALNGWPILKWKERGIKRERENRQEEKKGAR